MDLTAARHGFVVFLLWMPAVHCWGKINAAWEVAYSSTNICALEGSTVDISCSYKYPSTTYKVVRRIWHKCDELEPLDLREDPRYAKRVQYRCSNDSDHCTMTIRNVSWDDSMSYCFRFITDQQNGRYSGLPGVTLSVRGLQITYASPTVKCQSTCRPPVQGSVWYKNGEKIPGVPSFSYVSKDSYSCAVEGHEDFPSPPKCLYGQSCNQVIYGHRHICAVKGSSVSLSCQYKSSEFSTSKFWFSPSRRYQWVNSSQPQKITEDPQFGYRVEEKHQNGISKLRITDVKESDSAEYRFTFKTQNFEWRSTLPGITLTVTDPDLQVKVTIINTKWAVLQCHSRCLLPSYHYYVWYKNGLKTTIKSKAYTDYFTAEDTVSCALERYENFPSPPVCVLGQQCNRVVYPERNICAAKGSSVDISCIYKSREAVQSMFWFIFDHRHSYRAPQDLNKDSQFADRVKVFETEQGISTLTLSDLKVTDSVQYHFKFTSNILTSHWRYLSSGTSLTVTALRVKVIRATIHPSDTEAWLLCDSSCHPASHFNYVWFKNGMKVKNKKWFYEARFQPGEFISCALEGHEGHPSPPVYVLNVPSVLVSPSVDIMENSTVTLTCSDNTNHTANHTWYKDNQTVASEGPKLVLRSIKSSDLGQYHCTSENELGRRTSELIFINVKYAPKTTEVSVSPSGDIVERNSVKLTCSSDANPAANYTWYRNHQQLAHGPNNIYQFPSISSEDRGIYRCKSENQHGHMSSSISVDVQYAPKRPSVWLSPSGEIVEGSSVTLKCSSDANPAASYTWYKEEEDSPNASEQTFNISNISPEHSGNYSCVAQNSRGRQTSTIYLPVRKSMKTTAVGVTTAVILVLMFFVVFILMRRNRICKRTQEPGERPNITKQAGKKVISRFHRDQLTPNQRQQKEPGEIHYSSIHFSAHKDECIYSNVLPVHQHRSTEEEEEDSAVLYSAVKYTDYSRDTNQESAGHLTDLYSTVNKMG